MVSKTLGVIFNIEVMRGAPAAQFARQIEKLEARIRKHIDEHYQAGANHVLIYPARTHGSLMPDEPALEALAPAR
jgi:hypothetical protein